ncbi:glycosyltransferase [Raineyella fluvialis]|uniref:Glycosyltransferase n=1 Tax=Raineyella fluvialis TaxID=2662261 RepID=A0A5Q2FII0_9ACTN|nr:glycosyltransferase family 2 protein [Raineyella fluvialis]QGF24973.1 glycosyltransferase [Raineyella fluvialis]
MAYVRDYLIPAARAHGYTFTTLPASSSAFANGNVHVTPSWADEATLVVTKTLYVWPTFVMHDLFLFTVALTAAIGLLNIGLAFLRSREERRWRAQEVAPTRTIPVTVLLAAYNEEKLIERTIRTVLASSYPISEVVVVDDGSTDATSAVVTRLMAQDARIRLLRQPNAGKSAALNHGLTTTQGEVVITIDADTIVGAQTVSHLMRRYERDAEGRIGVVAGAVRVGNYRSNVLTRWQALEYVTQIGIDRAAQAVLNAIAIVPGACTAWRREAILEAGGFKDDNLAEDADLALTLHRLGWRVDQAGEAYAFTEAPDTMDDLLKQRVRWTYGIMQAMWKHRSLLFSRRHPGLGFFVYPMYILNQLIPLVFLPIIVVVTVLSLENGGWPKIVEFFAAFVVYQFLVSFLAISFLGEDRGLLRIVPIYRVIYEPLRAYLLYATVVSALKGIQMRWNRVHRTGSVDPHLGAAAQRHGTVAPVGLTPEAERPGAPAPGGPR